MATLVVLAPVAAMASSVVVAKELLHMAAAEAAASDGAGTEPAAAGTEPAAAGTEPAAAGTEPAAAGTEPAAAGTEAAASGGAGTAGTEPAAAGGEPAEAGGRPGDAGREPDRVLVASLDGRPVECGAGLTLAADCSIADIDECALVWVAGYWTGLAAGARANAAVLPWLRARREGGAELIGHGPGAFLLAEAGLLSGRLATTYRAQVQAFRRHHPDVDLQPQRAITDAGGIYCAVGLDSGRDLLVTLIERRYGPAIAASIAAWALNDSQRGYRTASSAFDGQRYHGDDDVLKIQDWLEEHHREPISIEALAQRFAMSNRTLTRRFRAATGDSPSEYLRRIRIEAAKDLLRNSQLTVAEVAADVGYRDIGAFYDAFSRQTGHRPGAFRNAEWVAPC